MGRSPCCEQDADVKKGPWTPEEDKLLVDYIHKHGHGSWRRLPKLAGLNRCGKSCRLRWTNYLRPDIKRGDFTKAEEEIIINLHATLGNKWSSIAGKLKGRTDNEIKNYWNTHLRKKLMNQGIDPVTHRPRTDLLAGIPNLLAAAGAGGQLPLIDINAIKLHADAAKFQILQGLIRVLTTAAGAGAGAGGGIDHLMTTMLASGLLGQQQQQQQQLQLQQQLLQQLDGVDLSRFGQQFDGSCNLPPLYDSSSSPAMSSLSPDSLLERYAGAGFQASDVMGSPEIVPPISMTTTTPVAAAPMPAMVAADQDGGGSGGVSPCEQTAAASSSTFEELQNLNLDELDINYERCWTEMLLEQLSNNASDMYPTKNNTTDM